jgi:hypothetical protein
MTASTLRKPLPPGRAFCFEMRRLRIAMQCRRAGEVLMAL